MFRINAYFIAHRTLTLGIMWCLFALAMGYGLTALLVRPDWNFWLCLIPGLLCLYFRLLHARACDADRKAGSPQSASGPL